MVHAQRRAREDHMPSHTARSRVFRLLIALLLTVLASATFAVARVAAATCESLLGLASPYRDHGRAVGARRYLHATNRRAPDGTSSLLSGRWSVAPNCGLQHRLRGIYATAGTDDGHAAGGTNAAWALGHPEKII